MIKPTGNKSDPTSGLPVATITLIAKMRPAENRPGHEGTDDRIFGGHENFLFTGINHFGCKLTGFYVMISFSLCYLLFS